MPPCRRGAVPSQARSGPSAPRGSASLAWNEAQRDVVRSLFGLYRFQGEAQPDGYGERRNTRLRKAVEFLHEHAGEPLTVSDIARAADLSVRALQESFQRTLDRTPMNYLREVRLRQVHDDLVAAEPGTASVADIASRWGVHAHGPVLGRVPAALRRVPAADAAEVAAVARPDPRPVVGPFPGPVGPVGPFPGPAFSRPRRPSAARCTSRSRCLPGKPGVHPTWCPRR
ncbi:helix-turn-helix domain-containing protein [Curtobacterium sp. MCPF17_052]|uniref:helix-turn-helix domain-containing protein n=1 Tax=Curtobacterium sp. MCPF17_052 TaxID=2175655 RepID=UPI0034645A44